MKGSTWIEKYETKRGTKYRVRFREGKRKKSLRAGFSKTVARDAQSKTEIGRSRRSFALVDPDYKVSNAIDDYISFSEKTKPKSIEFIEYCMKALEPLRQSPLHQLQPFEIQKLRQGLLESHNVNGTNMIMGQVAACFQFALTHERLEKNPAKGMQMKAVKVAKFMNRAEIVKLLRACRFNRELARIVRIAVYTGMRQGEILRIDPARDIRGGHVFVWQTKTDEQRAVPFHAKIKRALYKVAFKTWNKDRLTRAYRRAILRAGLDFRFHDLRHTFCANYLQSGGTLADLMLITGHKNIKMLQIYAHFQKGYLTDRIKAYAIR